MDLGAVAFLSAFSAGVLSFASPCVFPLIPAYLAQLTGMSFDELTGDAVFGQICVLYRHRRFGPFPIRTMSNQQDFVIVHLNFVLEDTTLYISI